MILDSLESNCKDFIAHFIFTDYNIVLSLQNMLAHTVLCVCKHTYASACSLLASMMPAHARVCKYEASAWSVIAYTLLAHAQQLQAIC